MLSKLTSIISNLSPNLRRIIGNTVWLYADKIIQMGLGLLVGVWIARYLGPEQFGSLNYAAAFVGLFGPLIQLGLDDIVVRNLARDASTKDETLGTAFWLKLISSILTLLLIIGIVFLISAGNPSELRQTRWITIIIASGTIFQSFNIIDYWFQSQVQSKYIVLASNMAYVVINVVRIGLILIKAPLIAFALAMVAQQGLKTISLLIVYRSQGNLIKAWKFKIQYAKSLLKDSFPLILSCLVIAIYMRIDQVMLGQMVGTHAVGVYSPAVKMAELWYFIPSALIQSSFPSIVSAKEVSEQLYKQRLQKLLSLLAGIWYIIAIPISIFSEPLIMTLYGEDYRQTSLPLAILIWVGLFVSLGLTRHRYLVIEGLTRFAVATTAIGALLNVSLNLLLIPRYQVLGAAIATVVAQLFADYLSNGFYRKTQIVFWEQTRAIFLVEPIKFLIKKIIKL